MLLSPPTVSHWESIIPQSIHAKMDEGRGGGVCYISPFLSGPASFLNITHLQCDPVTAVCESSHQRPAPKASFLSRFFFFLVSVAFPANLSRGEESSVTPSMKKGWLLWAGVIQISSVGAAQLSPCPVLLTPSAPQTSKAQGHKDKGESEPKDLQH